ncbi:hypothetical protein WSM22_43800 [Cytophagales bacterium WSM2-2]|nr:hypothetical protein WSM22_43800 [Cytophagales bacterium WSM2-2]
MLITKVKVGKVTNLSEARYCAGMGVDLLSFPVSAVDPKTYQEITGWIAGPLFGIEVEKESIHILDDFEADFIVVDVDSIDLIPPGKKLIARLNVTDWDRKKNELIAIKDRILFLELAPGDIDGHLNTVIQEIQEEFDLLLAVSNSTDIDQVIKMPIAGISLEGGAEVRPGLKEYPLADILEKLEEF